MNKLARSFSNAILVALLVYLPGALALPDDREQPIKITADQALRNEKEGFTVYRGNVELEQGSLHISADKITIYRIVKEADKIVASGKPAQLQQQPDPAKGLLQARAGIIEYYKDEARVLLKRDAHIQQEGSLVTGDTIDYYINEELVKAGGPGGVEVVIPAQTVQRSGAGIGTTNSE